MPGKWLPFDEVRLFDGWMNKHAYTETKPVGDPLHRLGNEELAKISNTLSKKKIPQGTNVSRSEMNKIMDDVGAKLPPGNRQYNRGNGAACKQ